VYHLRVRRWLLLAPLGLVAVGCYSPVDKAHCAITCDPLANASCPDNLICGTDSFCHSSDEPLQGCLSGLIDAPRTPDAQIFPHDGPPDSLVLPTDAAMCSSEWHADFNTDPTMLATANRWTSSGAVAFDFVAQVVSGTWSAPDRTGLTSTPGFELQGETVTTLDLELLQVGNTAAFTLGLTDGTDFAQLVLTIGRPTAGADQFVLTEGAQTLLTLSSTIIKHRVRFDVQWTQSTATIAIDSGAAMPATFTKAPGNSIPGTLAVAVTAGANIDLVDVCVP
jgi:hypothetical protein